MDRTDQLAHDLRNILATILASLELLKRRLPDDPQITTLLDSALNATREGALKIASFPSITAEATASRTVLAVDDDGLILFNLVAMLEDLGHKVVEASSPQAALALVAREPAIDLVITDYLMPCMNGIELAEAIQQKRPDMPVILATGFGDPRPTTAIGVSKLAKPYSARDLADAIARAIGEAETAI